MTREEIMALDMEGVENRSIEIKDEMTVEGADLETLSAEVDALEARKNELITEMKKAQEAVAGGAGTIVDKEEEKRMATFDEIRSSEAYVNAYANFIKTGDDKEVRSVLTENGVSSSGTSAGVPVPTIVEDRIRTAWDKDEILSRVKRTNVKGILKVGFELSATDAVVHAEGAAAPAEETLNLGIVSLVPETLKKWLSISDEVNDMDGRGFIEYVMSEIEYRIVKLAADKVVADITSAPTTATKTACSVAHVETTGIADFVNALALLSDEAQNPVIIMNKQSYAYYKGLAMAAGYAVDPFDGMQVLFNNTLAVATATPSSGTVNKIAIVGDLEGESVNFTNGYEPTIKVDDMSLAEKDLIKVVGRLPMGHGVTACGRFAVVTKTGA